MELKTFVEQLKESKNKLLSGEADNLATFGSLRHTKQGLETFLNFNIAQLTFETLKKEKKTIICTSNMALVKIYNALKEKEKKHYINFKSKGIIDKKPGYVKTWDLITNNYNTVVLNFWYIDNFVTITPNNVLILDKLIKDMLKK